MLQITRCLGADVRGRTLVRQACGLDQPTISLLKPAWTAWTAQEEGITHMRSLNIDPGDTGSILHTSL